MLLKKRSGKNNPYALWIRELVNRRGWSWEQLAYLLGASFSSVKNWHHGKTMPIKSYRKAIRNLYEKEVKNK